MDRIEITLLAVFFCVLVIAFRLPGIFWPHKLKAFLRHYGLLEDGLIKVIGVLFMLLGMVILMILFKTVTLAKLIVFIGSLGLIALGSLHLSPVRFRHILGKIERRSAMTLRLLSLLSVFAALAAGLYLLTW